MIHIVTTVLVIGYIVDLIVSFKIILNLKEMSREFKDNTVEISEKVKKIIKKKYRLYRRLVNAFPRIKENVLYSKWDEIKQKIDESKEKIRIKLDNSKEELKIKIEISKRKFQSRIDNSKSEIKGWIDESKKNAKKL